jgi:hypothetical protein
MTPNNNSNMPTLTSKSRLIINAHSPANQSVNHNEYHLIELRKQHNSGFGFSIRGGREFNIPLFVLKLAENGPASLDDRLRIGDQILEINGHEAYNMTHGDAIERIKLGGNVVSLLVRRTGLPPPSITDIIAANAAPVPTQTTQPHMLGNAYQSDTSLLRTKSPYMLHNDYGYIQQQQQQQQPHQQQYHQYNQQKYFNSLSALTTNR